MSGSFFFKFKRNDLIIILFHTMKNDYNEINPFDFETKITTQFSAKLKGMLLVK